MHKVTPGTANTAPASMAAFGSCARTDGATGY
jgi:hypothetical protein